ncbi:hypothetical protein ACRJ4W_39495 [Streptomyces sp. GLT-R25]
MAQPEGAVGGEPGQIVPAALSGAGDQVVTGVRVGPVVHVELDSGLVPQLVEERLQYGEVGAGEDAEGGLLVVLSGAGGDGDGQGERQTQGQDP